MPLQKQETGAFQPSQAFDDQMMKVSDIHTIQLETLRASRLKENTTWDLVADIERVREKLGIEKWLVFGGSWGSTLSLAYSQTHPDRCVALVLRGIFLLRRSELEWFYQDGASHIWPDAWEPYLNQIPEAERGDLISAYYKQLTQPDEKKSLEAAKAWATWEESTSKLYQDPAMVALADNDAKWARIECHYFVNGGFFPEGHLISEPQLAKIRHLPCVVVQGRYDCVCPARSAWDLKKAWGEGLRLEIVDDAGHSAHEPGITRLLVEATNEMAKKLDW
ncbi:prolyl aminopeptidase serine peptidase merops family s33 [Trichosporon asahii var. asahii CBS 2479]|uniref:Prolyl aminopeptidase serine peptidase merops family s33 n=1 Tax=Trichosporon asahii var. asahii (strain ATCC 90039 / CBS 2479 / JCM 2466 / KCTC 7840 / NBRC 103889/ NCYC 2677 / UAMH 7654) TaxID=1186058 RepID=J6F108_TRIAS|nr:prolyl aminopeptidase serine peptidase merops family s33 [Trichosporon asahii var. asahii CBS 2479]EJT50614.1 prolyl aminopeptidase serine peptidase merops family s33 [Trichosporon asahii var. asahii CBS 2479]